MDADLEKRTKVSRACDYCKKRKFKCSGVSPCELCTKKNIQCEFSIIDRRTIRRKNKKRTIRNKPITNTVIGSHKISKNDDDNDQIDKQTLKLLTKKSKVPEQLQSLLTFPLHKLDNKLNEEEEEQGGDNDHERSEEGEHQHNDQSLPPGSSSESHNRQKVDIQGNESHGTSDGDLTINATGFDITTTSNDRVHKVNQQSSPMPKKIVIARERYPPKVLYDGEGNLRYFGESSPLSFLFQCRNVFVDKIGDSNFTLESNDSLEVIEDSDESYEIIQVALPSRQILDDIIKIFYMNIQQAVYFVNIDFFKSQIINPVYENYSDCTPGKIALVNLAIAVGLLYAENTNDPLVNLLQSPTMQSSAYFEFGFHLAKKHMTKGELWITEAFALAFCYYTSKQQRNSAWLMLGMAIRNAQALGLHRKFINESFRDHNYRTHRRRLFKSLYMLDRINSVLLGRPLIIDDYDWDDFDSEDIYDLDAEGNPIKDPRFECIIQACKISKLAGKVIRNYYLDGIINAYKAEKLAIELKLWSLSLPEPLQIDKIFRPETVNKMPLLTMHLSQLYSIVLLCRPFFMFVILNKKHKKHSTKKANGENLQKRPKTRLETSMCNFCKATTKSSTLIIQMVENYIISTNRLKSARAELNGLIHTCLMASLIVGLSILFLESNGYSIDDGYSSSQLMKYLNSSKQIFKFFDRLKNALSMKFHNIIEQMQLALMNKFNLDYNGDKIINSQESQNQQRQHGHDTLPQAQQAPPAVPPPPPHQQTQPSNNMTANFNFNYNNNDNATMKAEMLTNQQTSFNEDYDKFIDTFGNLPNFYSSNHNYGNKSNSRNNSHQYQTNGVDYYNANNYHNNQTPNHNHNPNHNHSHSHSHSSSNVPQYDGNNYNNHLTNHLPESVTSSTNLSTSSSNFSNLTYHQDPNKNNLTDSLDVFMYNVELSDILYDVKPN